LGQPPKLAWRDLRNRLAAVRRRLVTVGAAVAMDGEGIDGRGREVHGRQPLGELVVLAAFLIRALADSDEHQPHPGAQGRAVRREAVEALSHFSDYPRDVPGTAPHEADRRRPALAFHFGRVLGERPDWPCHLPYVLHVE